MCCFLTYFSLLHVVRQILLKRCLDSINLEVIVCLSDDQKALKTQTEEIWGSVF